MGDGHSVLQRGISKFWVRSANRPLEVRGEQPLRAELFSTDQLEQHAKALAGWHQVTSDAVPDRLLSRLEENKSVLLEAHRLVVAAVAADRRILPADEWLLDNFYLIEEQIRTARRHLPKNYSRELPKLDGGPTAGLPRVYDIALELISHVDGRVRAESLLSFVAAYQTITPLKLGELWAVPIMLRLALIENLRRVAVRMTTARIHREKANIWADRMIEAAEKDPQSLVLVMAEMTRSAPAMDSEFVAEFARRLQGQSNAMALPLLWLEQRLDEQAVTVEQLMHVEGQQQAADQVSIGNSIGSLRFLGAMDWRDFVESLSAVEQTLRGLSPAESGADSRDSRWIVQAMQGYSDVYGEMDFATRDQYRHVIERIAKYSRFSESEVATEAVNLARRSADARGCRERTAHVGYFLIDKGLPQLEAATAARISPFEKLRRLAMRHPLPLYLGAIAAIAVAVGALALFEAWGYGASLWLLGPLALLILLSTSQLSVAVVNWLVTLFVAPRPLPRMDFSDGIPKAFRTLVATPTMLVSPESVNDLIEALEVRYLANRDRHLHFALLTDWCDAQTETKLDDQALLDQARDGIDALNEKYKDERGDIFFLFHRPRRWNARERVWMGYERKRGKLADLNALLRGRGADRFALVVGATSSLNEVKYVITLDTDTQLSRDGAWQLVGTIAHPLNQPCFDDKQRVICEGYTILQPRVGLSILSARRSRFVRLFGGQAGIDPYTGTVSDVYQDLFDEGSFIGKGIYEVDAFERVLEGRFPENLILSHDLLEGCHARSALVSDIQLYESYPARYKADAGRRHRWIRGDWQIAMWAAPWVPGPSGGLVKNPLSALSRWKILDNLRRSLVPGALVLLLLLSWTIPLWPAWLWTRLVLAVMLLPATLHFVVDLVKRPIDSSWRLHLRGALRSFGRYIAQSFCSLTFLPDEAFYSSDAVLRTLARLTITRRNLLEWHTSTTAEQSSRADLAGVLRGMWVAPVLALAVGGWIARVRPDALAVSVPLLSLWLVSPVIAWWLSRPFSVPAAQLSRDDRDFLEELSRTTWRFYETFVGPEDNWLPPDNYQDYPAPVLAHRTSPTNMGLALLSNLAAYDFGFISTTQLEERTANSLQTMEGLERFRGHFFNWYDTRSLEALPPRYVSTVDSGNLVGHLLTLHSGILQLADEAILPPQALSGLAIVVRILIRVVADSGAVDVLPGGSEAAAGSLRPLQQLEQLRQEVSRTPATLSAGSSLLARLAGNNYPLLVTLGKNRSEQVRWWAGALARQAQAWLDEVNSLSPLATLPPPPFSHWPLDASPKASPLIKLCSALERLERASTLRSIAQLTLELSADLDEALLHAGEQKEWLNQLKRRINQVSNQASLRIAAQERLARTCQELSDAEFDFLFDQPRRLLAIGFNVTERRRDTSFYDLLASEARLASYVAIAEGQLKQEHWFALGRLLTSVGGEPTLISWSGSMFEYLMPMLVMPSFAETLLDHSCKGAVARQIAYGGRREVPWGISESGYNVTDLHLNYQYRAFGVPGLGFKRGLADDLVIAPYASTMALMVDPQAACANLRRMAAAGVSGSFGFYEAVDYTPSRVAPGQSFAVVRSFMAHHEGMSFLSLAYALLNRPMQRRFAAYPPFEAAEMLLHERVPEAPPVGLPSAADKGTPRSTAGHEAPMRVFNSPHTPIPEVHLLSNGRYHVMINNAGGGYSRWKDIAVTRWSEDISRDDAGTFCYLRDVTANDVWSASFQPTLKPSPAYEAIFPHSRAEFRRRDFEIDTHTDVTVSPEDDVELRRIKITNRSRIPRTIELTSYAEVVMADAAGDATHPAFSKLFVQTEIIRERQGILCTRRPRSAQEHPAWMLHLMSVHGRSVGETSYETDRARFLGRGRDSATPLAMLRPGLLSNGEGSVLDPIVAIRSTISLAPDETAVVDIVSGVGETREAALALAEKYHDRDLANRMLDLAWTHGQVILQQLNATESDAQNYARLASSIVYSSSQRRASASVLAKNVRGQSGLWGHGISGDLPIVLLRIADSDKVELVRQVVQAHAYWRFKGLSVDLVIWNEEQTGYRQFLQDAIVSLIAGSNEAHLMERPGGIFVRRPEQMTEEDRILMQSVARLVLSDSGGTLADQIERRGRRDVAVPAFVPKRGRKAEPIPSPSLPSRELIFANGLGGFTADGREYVITTTSSERTPAPWVNVLANPQFGTVVSESGSGYTWLENAHEFRLTPWYNDPVTDRGGEAIYCRDEESGRFWSPTPLPIPGQSPYVTRHGFGYSVFETTENGIASELTMYVAMDMPVKFFALKLRNASGRSRRLTVTCYLEWVLAELRTKSLMHLVTEVDPKTAALLARNPYSPEFPGWVAFLDASESLRTVTGDRSEFLGRNGTAASPAAMARTRLSGKVGPGLDPCGAMQVELEMAPGQAREIVFVLGAASSLEEAQALIQRNRGAVRRGGP